MVGNTCTVNIRQIWEIKTDIRRGGVCVDPEVESDPGVEERLTRDLHPELADRPLVRDGGPHVHHLQHFEIDIAVRLRTKNTASFLFLPG